MIIYNHQLIPFGEKITKEFIAEKTQSIPDDYIEWAKSKDENEIKKMVTEVVAFAQANNISSTGNLTILIDFEIKFKVMDDLVNEPEFNKVITDKAMDESGKINAIRNLIVKKLKKK